MSIRANAQDPLSELFESAEWTDPDQIRLYRLLTAAAMGVQSEENRLNAAGFGSTTQAKTGNVLAAPRQSQSPSCVPSGAAANPYAPPWIGLLRNRGPSPPTCDRSGRS